MILTWLIYPVHIVTQDFYQQALRIHLDWQLTENWEFFDSIFFTFLFSKTYVMISALISYQNCENMKYLFATQKLPSGRSSKCWNASLIWSTESRNTRSGWVSRFNSEDEAGSFDNFADSSVFELVAFVAALFMKAAAFLFFLLLLSFTVVKKYKYRFDTQLTLESHSRYHCGTDLALSTIIWPRKTLQWLFHCSFFLDKKFLTKTLETENIFKHFLSVWSFGFSQAFI